MLHNRYYCLFEEQSLEAANVNFFETLASEKKGQKSTKSILQSPQKSFLLKYIDDTSKKCLRPKSSPSKCCCKSHFNCCDNIRGSPFILQSVLHNQQSLAIIKYYLVGFPNYVEQFT